MSFVTRGSLTSPTSTRTTIVDSVSCCNGGCLCISKNRVSWNSKPHFHKKASGGLARQLPLEMQKRCIPEIEENMGMQQRYSYLRLKSKASGSKSLGTGKNRGGFSCTLFISQESGTDLTHVVSCRDNYRCQSHHTL